MRAPEYFLRELKAFDEDLRLRWSHRLELWQIERKVRRSLHPGTIKTDDWHDDMIRARDGYILVASVPPHGLSRTVLQKLKDSDLWSRGGWRRVLSAIEEAEELQEEKRWEVFSRDIQDYSKDVFNWLAIRDGRTVFNAFGD